MSRRNAAEKRPILPDPQFNSRLATMMVVRLMQHGKKSTAQRILSDAFGLINERTGGDPLELFETAVKNATPLVEVPLAGLVAPPIRCPWKCDRSAERPWPCAGW
jgi:small subunit ribosomal protein S7